MESDRTAGGHRVDGISPGNLVAAAGPTNRSDAVIQTNVSPTLDGLFRRILARKPDALALLDPPQQAARHRPAAERLTFAEADRAISALAAHFIEAGLPNNSVIAVQLPNTVEFMLTVLAAHRAGLVVALLPLLWRQAELTVALNRTGARAIVTAGRIDGINHADLAMNAAAEAFSIRHVCGFGSDLPEGMASLDQAIDRRSTDHAPCRAGRPQGRDHFVRRHGRRLPSGAAHASASDRRRPRHCRSKADLPQGSTVMSAFAPTSFAGLTSSLVVWLLTGGTLALHHPFDGDVLEQQINEHACDTLIAPAQLALRLGEIDMSVAAADAAQRDRPVARAGTGRIEPAPGPRSRWHLTDVYLFGEAGLFGARRAADGAPAPIMPGPAWAPRARSRARRSRAKSS